MARKLEAREDATICERLEATPFSFFSSHPTTLFFVYSVNLFILSHFI